MPSPYITKHGKTALNKPKKQPATLLDLFNRMNVKIGGKYLTAVQLRAN